MAVEVKWRWFQFNADGLFIASLAFVAGLFDIFYPDYEALTEQVGAVPVTYFVWNSLYLAGGVLMFLGFLRQWLSWELLGRHLIIMAATTELVRTGLAFGFTDQVVYQKYAVLFLLLTFFGLRARALLAPGGTAVIIGNVTEEDDE